MPEYTINLPFFRYTQNAEFCIKSFKIFLKGHAPKTPRKFSQLCRSLWESRNLDGKVNFVFHFPLGK